MDLIHAELKQNIQGELEFDFTITNVQPEEIHSKTDKSSGKLIHRKFSFEKTQPLSIRVHVQVVVPAGFFIQFNSGAQSAIQFFQAKEDDSYTLKMIKLPIRNVYRDFCKDTYEFPDIARIGLSLTLSEHIQRSLQTHTAKATLPSELQVTQAALVQKKIYTTRIHERRCEHCLNLGRGNICSVHQLKVEDGNCCARFYPYRVDSGGRFSPR